MKRNTWRNNPENCEFCPHRCKNLKCYICRRLQFVKNILRHTRKLVFKFELLTQDRHEAHD